MTSVQPIHACQDASGLPVLSFNARLAQLAEHYLDTVGVIGSSPIPRTSLRSERSVERRLPRRSATARRRANGTIPKRSELRLGKPAKQSEDECCHAVTHSAEAGRFKLPAGGLRLGKPVALNQPLASDFSSVIP